MRKSIVAASIFCLVAGFSAGAHASLDNFLTSVNVQARANIDNFAIRLGAQFGVPVPQVQAIIHSVDSPADAFMALQIGQMTGRHPDAVLQTYSREKENGWGAIAKSMGIKPGSAEFHALKRGDLAFTGKPGGRYDRHNGKDKGKDKGLKKDKVPKKDKGHKKDK